MVVSSILGSSSSICHRFIHSHINSSIIHQKCHQHTTPISSSNGSSSRFRHSNFLIREEVIKEAAIEVAIQLVMRNRDSTRWRYWCLRTRSFVERMGSCEEFSCSISSDLAGSEIKIHAFFAVGILTSTP